jgi:hypothetical protein
MSAKTDSQIARHSFFAKNPIPTGILIPETPVVLQANCAQKGSWVLGEKVLGNEPINCYLVGFKLSQEYDPYKDAPVNWTILHFVPINCDFLKSNLVYTTKIKNMASNRKGSLYNLGNKIAEIISSGLDPREVAWTMQFIGKSGSLPSGEPYMCAVIDFAYKLVPGQEMESLVAVIEQSEKLANLTIAAMANETIAPAIASSTKQPQLESAK